MKGKQAPSTPEKVSRIRSGGTEKIGFIGAGTVGTALASQLSQKGYTVSAVYSLRPSSTLRFAREVPSCKVSVSPQEVADLSELVFITTPDDVIPSIAEKVNWRRGQKVVHCSGADSLDILEPARQAGALIGSFHPLQTFADLSRAIENLPGSTFALEAGGDLLTSLKEMAEVLEGEWIILKPGDKVLYHAAAVFASNYVVTLVKLATDLWKTFDLSPDRATRALVPLLYGTVRNIDSVGLPGCLTGPIARGDSGTLRKHLKALEARAPTLLSAYVELGLQTIPIALAKGRIDLEKAKELASLLEKKLKERG